MPAHRSTVTRDRFRQKARHRGDACHICGQAIDYSLPRDDDRSFVADHVIPLARGGQDVESNLKAAHRECNSRKRARIVAPIVRRSGTLQ